MKANKITVKIEVECLSIDTVKGLLMDIATEIDKRRVSGEFSHDDGDHRGTLAESMKTEIHITNYSDLEKHINKPYNKYGLSVEDIKFDYCGYDERIDWDTFYVSAKIDGEWCVVGMIDEEIRSSTFLGNGEISFSIIKDGKSIEIKRETCSNNIEAKINWKEIK